MTLTGSQFPANTGANLYLGHSAGEPFTSWTTDGLGQFSLTVTLPDEWPLGTPLSAGPLPITVITTDGTVTKTAMVSYAP